MGTEPRHMSIGRLTVSLLLRCWMTWVSESPTLVSAVTVTFILQAQPHCVPLATPGPAAHAMTSIGDASIECPSCTRPVCRRCLSEPHTVFDDQCLICHDRECAQCGRNPEVLPCPVCARLMCSACRINELCPACSGLTHAPEDQLSSLPTDLAATGAIVLTGSDQNAMTVLINRGDSIESAVIRDGSIDSWIAFGKNEINDMYRLRLPRE